jgi:hypothetical protein
MATEVYVGLVCSNFCSYLLYRKETWILRMGMPNVMPDARVECKGQSEFLFLEGPSDLQCSALRSAIFNQSMKEQVSRRTAGSVLVHDLRDSCGHS